MPDLMSKGQHSDVAKSLVASLKLVRRGNVIYIPVDWETEQFDPPPVGDKIWIPLSRDDKLMLANRSNILFGNDGEIRNFDLMLRQLSPHHEEQVTSILVKTMSGLRELAQTGQLITPTGQFVPNYVRPTLNQDEKDKAVVWGTIVEWLGGDEDGAHSLLHHLATSLAPGYSAVKYVLLLGDGRNGKSVLLEMMSRLYGPENVSNVSRQLMAERNQVCVELNDKLLNVIFDGEMAYIKDSSMEKTLIAGEAGYVRMLFENGTTKVQTNALFIEALNQEPKARDKSGALQKRLVRYRFPNTYAMDKLFFHKMTSEPMLGALLALLIDHYVPETELAEKLAPTEGSLELQLEQVWLGAPILQYLDHCRAIDPKIIDRLARGKVTVATFLASFKPWAESQGIAERTDADLISMMRNHFDVQRTSQGGRISRIRPDTEIALNHMKGEPDGSEDSK